MPPRFDSSSTPSSHGDLETFANPQPSFRGRAGGGSGRWVDWALMAVCGLPALALMGAIAVGQWMQFRQVRAIFFRQTRVGRHGQVFTLIKFRTMSECVDRAGRLLPDTQRVTRFGKFLRNTHLDELPQLWNILRGEMSFIGPRPEMESIHAWACERIEGFEARLAVRPGITGLAQTTQGYTGLDETAYREKLRLDLEFVRAHSCWFQAKILVRTALWMVRGKGWRWEGSSVAPGTEAATQVNAQSAAQAQPMQAPQDRRAA